MKNNYSGNRRDFLKKGLGLGLFATAGYSLSALTFADNTQASEGVFEITRTEKEWRELLTPQQYDVLREEATERAFSSPLDKEKREGMFHCAGCDLAVYDSKTKFDSRTGWPSFYEAVTDDEGITVGTHEDNSFFMKRTEVHCRRCGGHFGHIFDDGPQPTGMRHCINGLSLTFKVA
uniref:peptide-methionine (R)-S-oxide reductase n=1 Tax=uncultured Thiotrichaceae bacterium TaxID=298394 RepID=A0A6S6UFL2_9GAMM|nr:MAG: Peptide methionine sulfoxide reductase MsrB (EC [uncultured Thiotrichaceae bacterium]